MLLTENEQKWKNIISEELHVTDNTKLGWMSKYAQIHEIHEGLQPNTANVSNNIYATPLNTMGMGNPMMPQANQFQQTTGIGNTGSDFHNPMYQVGSGDIPMSTLTIALEIAAQTIGFELVPVVPSNGPWTMLSYMDFPYAGGKLGRLNETYMDGKGPGDENKPIYVKFAADATSANKKLFTQNKTIVYVTNSDDTPITLKGIFMGYSRIDNNMIVKVEGVGSLDGTQAEFDFTPSADNSIADVFASKVTVKLVDPTIANPQGLVADVIDSITTAYQTRPELVTGAADHIQNFSNFFDGSQEPMNRAQNETGVGNTIGARMFTKMVQMGSYEVTGTVTRQQLQDMPLYGIDVVGQVIEAMQNEISQAINNRLLDRVFKLGVTNYEIQRDYQGVDLNLYLGGANTPATKQLSDFASYNKYLNINNQTVTSVAIPNAIQNTASENVTTHQRRIMSRMLAAANLIANVSRRGRATWAVTNVQILSALQDAANFVVAPMSNTLVQDGSQSLYFAGSVAGLNLYVDPYMTWDDTRICVGRKANMTGNNQINGTGVVFMPYILADTIQIVAEGTMAPKMLCNSRFAIVDAGFYPEQNYYTFMVDDEAGII